MSVNKQHALPRLLSGSMIVERVISKSLEVEHGGAIDVLNMQKGLKKSSIVHLKMMFILINNMSK